MVCQKLCQNSVSGWGSLAQESIFAHGISTYLVYRCLLMRIVVMSVYRSLYMFAEDSKFYVEIDMTIVQLNTQLLLLFLIASIDHSSLPPVWQLFTYFPDTKAHKPRMHRGWPGSSCTTCWTKMSCRIRAERLSCQGKMGERRPKQKKHGFLRWFSEMIGIWYIILSGIFLMRL